MMIPFWVQIFLWLFALTFAAFIMFVIAMRIMVACMVDSVKDATAWETIRAEFKHVGVVDGQRIYEVDGKQFTEGQLKATFNNWFEKDNGDKNE